MIFFYFIINENIEIVIFFFIKQIFYGIIEYLIYYILEF